MPIYRQLIYISFAASKGRYILEKYIDRALADHIRLPAFNL